MQRLSGVTDDEAGGLARETIDSASLLLGRTSNLVRILAKHDPFLAHWYLGFACAVRQPALGACTDVRIRNFACTKTPMLNQCAYYTTRTSSYGKTLGLSDAEFDALASSGYRDSPLFSRHEKEAVAWTETMTRNTAARDWQLWEELRENFNDTEIFEISLNIALFNMTNRLNDSFWAELESKEINRRQGRVNAVPIEALEDFAGRFAVTGRAERESRTMAATCEKLVG